MKLKRIMFLLPSLFCFVACQPQASEVYTWKDIKREIIDTGVAKYEENPNYNENGIIERKTIEMSYYEGSMDNGAADTIPITTQISIDATNLEDIDYQYSLDIKGVSNDSYSPNMTIGLLNKKTGEFVFSNIGNDCYYRVNVHGKEQFGENQTFSTGEEYKVASYMICDTGNFKEHFEPTSLDNHWHYQIYVQFTHDMDKNAMNDFEEDYVWFVTSCTKKTYAENYDWYYENSFHTVEDFYLNLYRFYDIASDIIFFEPRIVDEQNP